MTSLRFTLYSVILSRENINLTIQLCHLSIYSEQSRVNKGQKGFWQTHQQSTFASFPGTKISYIIQVDATPFSVQFEHQRLMRQNWGSGWNMPRARHTCRERAQHISATFFYLLLCSAVLIFSGVTNCSRNTILVAHSSNCLQWQQYCIFSIICSSLNPLRKVYREEHS